MAECGRGTVLITGATSGIGAEYARRFAERGHDLIVTGRRKEVLASFARELADRHGVRIEVIIAELSDPEGIEAVVRKVEETEDLGVLVNNAGFTSREHFYLEDIENQIAMVRVHLEVAMRLIHAAVPKMLARKDGVIINVSSLQAFTALPGSATYSSTKAFLKNFSEILQLELAGTGIKVQALFPGFTRTDLGRNLGFDMHSKQDEGLVRWMDPEETVEISLRCLESKKIICIPGTMNKVNYLLIRILPRSVWYRLAPFLAKRMP